MSKLTDDIDTYLRTGSLVGLSLVRTRDELLMRELDRAPPLTPDEAKTLHALDALLSSEPPERIRRARGHQKRPWYCRPDR